MPDASSGNQGCCWPVYAVPRFMPEGVVLCLRARTCRALRVMASTATALCPSLRTQPGSVSSQTGCVRPSRTTPRPMQCWSGGTVRTHSYTRWTQSNLAANFTAALFPSQLSLCAA